jgi:hypothetical protein
MPNDQWDDFALSRQFAVIDQRIGNFEDAMKGLAHFPIDVATAALNIEHLTHEVARVARTVAEVKGECEKIRETRQTELENRQKGRTAIVVAVITGSATVLAALVVLLAQVAGS